MKNIVIIPARYNSSRLPGKVLLDLCGKPVIQRVYEQVLHSKKAHKILIATDDTKVAQICKSFGATVHMTKSSHESGTDRIAEVAGNFDCQNIVNVQGDEPIIDPKLIDNIFAELEQQSSCMVSSMARIRTSEELADPNVVKVTVNSRRIALYFSRAPIPFPRGKTFNDALIDDSPHKFYRHIGIYGYHKDFLLNFSNMSPSLLEQTEKLEQLRVLENGYPIKMIETAKTPIGIDTIEDLEKVRTLLKKTIE